MSRLVERLAELRRHVEHLHGLRPRVKVRQLLPLPGFRNVLIHEYVNLDFDRVIMALDHLQPVEDFAEAAHRFASSPE